MGLSVFPILLVAVGGWLLWWGNKRRGALGSMPGDWWRVTGTVIDTGDGSTTPPRIEYRTPDGRRLRVAGPMSVPFTVGQEIAVLIDPRDQTRATLDITEREAARVVRLLMASGGGLVLLGVVIAIAFV